MNEISRRPRSTAGEPGSFIPDGESVGDYYHAFDLLEWNGENLRPMPYRARLTSLVNLLLSGSKHRNVRLVKTAFTTQQKTELWQRLRLENREGIVFKRLDAPYTPGMPVKNILAHRTASRLRTFVKASPTSTEHPSTLRASECCPGQPRAWLGVFHTARPVRLRS